MSNLYISELNRRAHSDDASGTLSAAQLPVITNQVLTVGASSTQSAALSAETRFVRLHASVACHIAVGENPTATTSSLRLAADATEYFGVAPGTKIAVIAG